jgi:hypothetical protein
MALFLVSCTGEGGFFGGQRGGDGGIDMGVAMQGLKKDQHFCFTWTLYQEDKDKKGWTVIDQRDDEICGDGGEDNLSDFATCYDGKHFLVQYDVTVRDDKGDVLDQATATSGGGPKDVCVKNKDVESKAIIQFNNEGKAGGVNPEIEVDQVCSNDKVQKEDKDLVSAFWIQPDACDKDKKGTPDSFCSLACGKDLETARYDITQDGRTRFIFNVAKFGSSWDIIYLPFPADLNLSELHLVNSPFAIHHFAYGSNYGREELANTLGSFRLGKSVGVIFLAGDKIVIKYDDSANCDGPIDLDAKEQILKLPNSGKGCEPIGVVSTGGSGFDIVLGCDGDLKNIECDADLSKKDEVCESKY